MATLRAWIQEGAPWTGHWAFEKIADGRLPSADWGKRAWNARDGRGDWSVSPIDVFAAEKLEKEGVQPSPEEDPARLIFFG